MNVGSVVFRTDQGLGYLARDFFDHGVITHPLVLVHGRRPEHPEWYPADVPHLPTHRGPRSLEVFRDWLRERGITHFLALETPFNWEFFDVCREVGVRSVLMPMHECEPDPMPSLPDLFLCPSELDLRWAEGRPSVPRTFLPVPVPDDVPWRRRGRVRTFVHNAGNGGMLARNGSGDVLRAMEYVRSPARLIVRSQELLADLRTYRSSPQIDWRVGASVPFVDLWTEGDAFLFPEGFNGLSLPLQEARAAGMLVMAGDRFPMNAWLPREPLIPVKEYRRERIAGHLSWYDRAVYDPRDIAAKIDEWYDRDASEHSERGRDWADATSWKVLFPRYQAALRGA